MIMAGAQALAHLGFGTTGAGEADGTISVGAAAGTTGAGEAMVMAGTDGIAGTTSVGAVVGTTGAGEATVTEVMVPGAHLTAVMPTETLEAMHTTEEDEVTTTTIIASQAIQEL